MAQVPLILTTQADGTILVGGSTYPHKDTLKALGGRWNPSTRSWILPVGCDISALNAINAAFVSDLVPTSESSIRRLSGIGTFSIRDQIKKAGGRWDPTTKEWIVPADFVLPARASSAHTSDNDEVPKQERARPHCSICRQEGHRRDHCDYECPHCKAHGQHIAELCPIIDKRWKRFASIPEEVRLKSPQEKFHCSCSMKELCWICENVCCEKAKMYHVTDDIYRTECQEHGERKFYDDR